MSNERLKKLEIEEEKLLEEMNKEFDELYNAIIERSKGLSVLQKPRRVRVCND